ncbi:MAG: trigger factor [Verrucomicrobiota bacterium]
MNIAIEEISTCRRRLSIEVPAAEVEAESNKVLDEFQKFASIKGFRPGKAPRKMVASKHRKDIESEMKRTLVPQAFRDAVREKNLSIVNTPSVEDLKYDVGSSLSFITTVDLAPEFDLPRYKGLKVEKADTEVKDEDIDEVISNVLEQRADYRDIEGRSIQQEDFAIITYTGTIDGKPISELVPEVPNMEKQEKFWLWIKEDVFLPKFGEQLIGASVGDTVSVHIDFPADFPQERLQGKQAVYEVKIDGLKEKVLPELTDEIAQEIAQMDQEELLQVVRGNLERQKKDAAKNEHAKQIFEQLKNSVSFELPESSVQAETQSVIQNIIRENQQRGISEDVLEENKKDILSNAEISAKDHVKMNFILNSIAKEENIEVSNDEIGAELQMMSQQYQIPPDKLFRQLEENGAILRLQDDILRRKTVDFLLQSAEIA